MYVTIPKILDQEKNMLILTDCLVDKFVNHLKLKMKK